MKLSQRVLFTVLLAVTYGASLVILVTGFVNVLPLAFGALILTAASLTVVNWLWDDYRRKEK